MNIQSKEIFTRLINSQTQPRHEGDVCSQPLEAGDCDAYVINYGFNSTLGQCQAFYYGGCGGTDNRFNSSDECEAQCVAQQPDHRGKLNECLKQRLNIRIFFIFKVSGILHTTKLDDLNIFDWFHCAKLHE